LKDHYEKASLDSLNKVEVRRAADRARSSGRPSTRKTNLDHQDLPAAFP
jgi:hypothetical protein